MDAACGSYVSRDFNLLVLRLGLPLCIGVVPVTVLCANRECTQ